jgi:tRNA threonylcarbamoyladenosine biosynthesis protein TsaB
MRLLAIDTTTGCGSVALLEGPRLLAEINAESGLTHSARLLRTVDFLLKKNGLEVKDLDGFAVAAGPGSFTGIRIGLSTVKAFAFASKKQVAPVSTLAALALKLRDTQGRLLSPFLDAKKGEVYAALYELGGREFKAVIGEGAYSPDAFLARLPAHRVIHFIGNGVDVYKDKIRAYLKDNARFSTRSFFIGHEVGLLGQEILRKGRAVTGEALEPLYYRRSQAEDGK